MSRETSGRSSALRAWSGRTRRRRALRERSRVREQQATLCGQRTAGANPAGDGPQPGHGDAGLGRAAPRRAATPARVPASRARQPARRRLPVASPRPAPPGRRRPRRPVPGPGTARRPRNRPPGSRGGAAGWPRTCPGCGCARRTAPRAGPACSRRSGRAAPRRRRHLVEPVPLGEKPDERMQGGGHGVALVVEQGDRAREPLGEALRDVGARPVP